MRVIGIDRASGWLPASHHDCRISLGVWIHTNMSIRENTVPADLQSEFLNWVHQYIILMKQGGVFQGFPIHNVSCAQRQDNNESIHRL